MGSCHPLGYIIRRRPNRRLSLVYWSERESYVQSVTSNRDVYLTGEGVRRSEDARI